MITIYGIKNCDTMQKAFKWLAAENIAYTFHDYREAGIDKATIEHWLKHLPLDKLLNNKSTTYRSLTDSEKASLTNPADAIALMIQHPTLIKRPVWDLGNKKFFVGWKEDELSKLL